MTFSWKVEPIEAPPKKPRPTWIHDGTRLYRSDWPVEPVNRPPIENNGVEFTYPPWLIEALEEARLEREALGEARWTYEPPPLEPLPPAIADEVLQWALNIQADRERAVATAIQAAATAKWLAENGLEAAWDPANNVVILATGVTLTGKEADRRLAALSLGGGIGVMVVGAGGVAVVKATGGMIRAGRARRLLRESLGTDPFNGLGRAHHVLPVALHDSPVAQRLRNWDIDLNSADNGMWLPSQNVPGWTGAIHPGRHTDKYVDHVEELLGKATSREQAIDYLEHLKRALREGTLLLGRE